MILFFFSVWNFIIKNNFVRIFCGMRCSIDRSGFVIVMSVISFWVRLEMCCFIMWVVFSWGLLLCLKEEEDEEEEEVMIFVM